MLVSDRSSRMCEFVNYCEAMVDCEADLCSVPDWSLKAVRLHGPWKCVIERGMYVSPAPPSCV